MVEPLSSYRGYGPQTSRRRRRTFPAGKPSLVGYGLGWSPETHENYRQSERLELYQKYIDQLLADGKAYKSYVTEEELAAERERQEVAGETPRYINEYLGMSEEEKAAYIVEREAAGIIYGSFSS